jgi:hypothetical protein
MVKQQKEGYPGEDSIYMISKNPFEKDSLFVFTENAKIFKAKIWPDYSDDDEESLTTNRTELEILGQKNIRRYKQVIWLAEDLMLLVSGQSVQLGYITNNQLFLQTLLDNIGNFVSIQSTK